MGKKSSRGFIAIIGISLVILALITTIIVLATRSRECATDDEDKAELVMAQCLNQNIGMFHGVDGMTIRWYPAFNRESDLDTVMKGDYQMIEVDILIPRDGDAAIVVGTSLTLDDFLTSLNAASKGVKLVIDTDKEAESVIKSLSREAVTGAKVLSVPIMAQRAGEFTWSTFQKLLTESDLDPETTTISFDLRKRCCDTLVGIGVFEYLKTTMASNGCFTYALELMAEHLSEEHWVDLKQHLDAAPKLRLLLSAGSNANSGTAFGLLRVRNDMDGYSVWYNIRGIVYDKFVTLSSVGGSPLLYFNINPRDASEIIWSHNTDTWDQLNVATQGETMMIEGDIMLLGQGTSNQTNIPIMAHDKGDFNNLTFEQWLDEIIKVDKGMKLDFKYMDAVGPALDITIRKKDKIAGPIWINADILKGPDGPSPRFNPETFLSTVSVLPGATLSLGWTTIQKGTNYNLNYTMDMVRAMHDLCRNISGQVTFPIRAEQFRHSLESFDWLLRQSRDYTLTVWTGHGDNVTKADMDVAKELFEDARIYFDLPPVYRPNFSV